MPNPAPSFRGAPAPPAETPKGVGGRSTALPYDGGWEAGWRHRDLHVLVPLTSLMQPCPCGSSVWFQVGVTPTGVQMFVEGEWIWVPDHTIQYRALPGDTGETDGGIGAGVPRTGMASRWAMQPTVQSFRRTRQRFLNPRLPFVKAVSSLSPNGCYGKLRSFASSK